MCVCLCVFARASSLFSIPEGGAVIADLRLGPRSAESCADDRAVAPRPWPPQRPNYAAPQSSHAHGGKCGEGARATGSASRILFEYRSKAACDAAGRATRSPQPWPCPGGVDAERGLRQPRPKRRRPARVTVTTGIRLTPRRSAEPCHARATCSGTVCCRSENNRWATGADSLSSKLPR